MQSDGDSNLDSLWNSASLALFNAYEAYGWVVPALLLTLLLVAAIALLAWWLEDLPIEPDIFNAVRGVFRWTRKTWRGGKASSSLSQQRQELVEK